MKKEIYKGWGSNMVGQEWEWVFSLEKQANGTYTLSGEQNLIDPEEIDEPFEFKPVSGLRRGADIYEQFQTMLSEMCIEIEEDDVDAIANEIVDLDPKVADHFRRAKDLLPRRAQRAELAAHRARDAKLAPFRQIIDAYCAKLTDHRTRGGGGISRPSERSRVWAFLEDYVCKNGELPTGYHSWNLSNGFLSGSRDFSDLTNGSSPGTSGNSG